MKQMQKRFFWIVTALLFLLVVGCSTAGRNSGLKRSAGDREGSPRCLLDPGPGPCKGLFEKYYYDRKTGKCRPFIYGGCEGTVPFETLEECRQACEGEK